jgi:HD superfamily phosphohydrolase
MAESLNAKTGSILPVQVQGSLSELQSPFVITRAEQEARALAREGYLQFTGKDPLSIQFMRSIVDPSNGIQLDPANPFERVILDLRDIPAIQRLKYISQVSAASWVYPDAVHARFPHVIGSAQLTAEVLNHLSTRANDTLAQELREWGPVCVAFAMTHDLGHIAPGSHVAHRVWFDGKPDCHEEISHMLLQNDPGLRCALEQALSVEGANRLNLVVAEDPSVPRWTWQLITAGGWNADRGDWVRRDSVMCGAHYGLYEAPIIKKNLVITDAGDLAIGEKGVSALEAFFSARFDMYRNVYQHPACRVGELIHVLVGRRARELFTAKKLNFTDDTMEAVLSAESGTSLNVPTVMNMIESWWQYHLTQWCSSEDRTLATLAAKVLRREPFKRFPNDPDTIAAVRKRAEQAGLDPDYFVLVAPPSTVKLEKDLKTSLQVFRKDGSVVSIMEHSRLMNSFNELKTLTVDGFVAAPEELLAGITSH